VQLGGLYRYIHSLPQRPGTLMDMSVNTLLGASEYDPAESNYQEMYGLARDFLQKSGKGRTPHGGYNPKSNALYYMKKSMRIGDTKGAERFAVDFGMNGGTDKDLEKGLLDLEPLSGLNQEMQKEFLKKLSPGDTEKLKRSYYFWQSFTAPHTPAIQMGNRPIAQFVRQMHSSVKSGIHREHRLQNLVATHPELQEALRKNKREEVKANR
jgi:hypothetical protein